MDGVKRQIEISFLPDLGKKPEWAPWTATDSLFGEFSLVPRLFSFLHKGFQ